MTSVTKRIRAFIFLVIVVLSFPQAVSAAVTAPSCGSLNITPTSLTPADASIHASFKPSTGLSNAKADERYDIVYSGTGDQTPDPFDKNSADVNIDFAFSINDLTSGPKSVFIRSGSQTFCETNIMLENGVGVIGTPGTGLPPTAFDLCQQAGANRNTCDQCLANKEVWTGVGCIPFSTGTGLVRALISLGLGVTGTIVVIMTLYAGFMFSTSQGDPKRVDEAKGAMTSAIIGAFFIIFSVTMLQFIGVTILHLPSFG